MLKAKTSQSTDKSAKTAGTEAAKSLKSDLTDIKLVFAYASCKYDLNAMLDGITSELPGIPVIGNTSFSGVVTPAGYITGEDGFLGMMGISGEDLCIGVASAIKQDCAVSAGMKAAVEAMKQAGQSAAPDYFYMAAPPGEEEFYLKGISKIIGRVPFFGGSAADNAIAGDWKLYTNEGVFADGVAVAFFYQSKPIINKFTGAYHETKDMGIITKVEHNRSLVEIDNKPALEVYAGWRGMSVDQLKGGDLLTETITSPLGIKDRLGDLTAIRHPMNGNDDGSMAIGSNLAVGTAVIRMEATVDELISSAVSTLKEVTGSMKNPAAYHLVHCGGRSAGMGKRVEEVAAQVIEAADGIPFIMEFTFGEYGYESDGRNTCGGLMLSYTGFEQ